MKLAKIRAFRIWYQNEYKSTPYVSSETKLKSKNYHQLIQSSFQALSSFIGGCDSLKITYKNINHGIKQQLILQHEGLLHKVIDPFLEAIILKK